MPNWCHDTLEVSGPRAAVEAFVKRVQTDEQPLSFGAHVPEPSAEVYAKMAEEEKVPCTLCGSTGVRPVTRDEAAAKGAEWRDGWENLEWLTEQAKLAVADRPKCNGCAGTGKADPFMGGWYGWRANNWGCKWDANFEGPFIAFGGEGSDITATVEMQGVADTGLGSVTYSFTTPWGPPIPWLMSTARQEPDLTFVLRYAEMGNDFAGQITAHGDEVDDKELKVEEVLSVEQRWF